MLNVEHQETLIKVRVAAEALDQSKGSTEELNASWFDHCSEDTQINSSWLFVGPTDCGLHLCERRWQHIKFQTTHKGQYRLSCHWIGHGNTLFNGGFPRVERVAFPLLRIRLHPIIVAGNSPWLQLNEVIVAWSLPIVLRHFVVASRPGLGSKGQAGTGVNLLAGKLCDQLCGIVSFIVVDLKSNGAVTVIIIISSCLDQVSAIASCLHLGGLRRLQGLGPSLRMGLHQHVLSRMMNGRRSTHTWEAGIHCLLHQAAGVP